MLVSDAARLTMIPAEVEMISEGIWETSPSPMVSRVYVSAAWRMGIFSLITPMNSPPTILMTMMTMLATASPRTNLLAPSMEP